LPQQLTHYLADALCSLPVHVHMVECSRQLEDGTFQVVRSHFLPQVILHFSRMFPSFRLWLFRFARGLR
jgi:hypothetical protein